MVRTFTLKKKFRKIFQLPVNLNLSLHLFIQLRYIYSIFKYKNYKKLIMSEFKRCDYNNITIKDIMGKIKIKVEKKDIIALRFDSFRKNEKSKLFEMLKHVMGTNVDFLKNDHGDYKFDLNNWGFFNFLLDSYDTSDSKHFRKEEYSKVSTYFLSLLKYGATALVNNHPDKFPKKYIKKHWNLIFNLNIRKLNEELDKLKHNISKIEKKTIKLLA